MRRCAATLSGRSDDIVTSFLQNTGNMDSDKKFVFYDHDAGSCHCGLDEVKLSAALHNGKSTSQQTPSVAKVSVT